MDFSVSEEQKDIQKAARKFAEGEFDPDYALDLERNGQFPSKIWKRACELGFIGIHFPERYGGQGLGLLENALVVEEFCRQHSGIGITLGLADFGSEMILRFGNDEQKKKCLIPITLGESVSSLAYLEKDKGDAITCFNTIAIKDSNGYVVNGNKSFVINCTLSGPMIVLCRLGNVAPEQHVALIAEKGSARVSASMVEGRVGMRMVPMATLIFNDLKVHKENLLGDEGQGRFQLLNFINEMRIEAAAIGIGIAQGAFDLALAYSKQRAQFGQKIASFEAIRNKLADMATRIEMTRLLTYKAAWDWDGKGGNFRLGYMAKMISGETAFEVAGNALHIFGGYGYIVENQIEHFYRDAQMIDIFGELGQTQRNLIADQVIGKT